MGVGVRKEVPTRMRSKAEGVPPRWTWPRMVTLVSYPRRFTTSCEDTGRAP